MNAIGQPVRVRFAPSPTGRTHIGSARTALYNFLLSRQTRGNFILRIEDTDQKRYVQGAEQELIDGLTWLGINWDEGPEKGGPFAPYRQSERKEIYREFAHQLINNGNAFYCFCTPERLERVRKEKLRKKERVRYDGSCRRLTANEVNERITNGDPHVIRFRMPLEGTITVHDLLRGNITFENQNLDDYILVKSDGLALYHLAAMVDDHLMGVTHVIRSSEWLSTFGLHAHIIRSFGWEEPEWVHLSVFLKPSGKGKMSKRDSSLLIEDGHSIFIGDLVKMGYLPEAVVNWIALMGWSYDDHTEFFTIQDLIKKFSLSKLNPAPAAINFSKLDYFNGLHIRALEVSELAQRLEPIFSTAGIDVNGELLLKVTPLIQERLIVLGDALARAGFFFEDEVQPDPKDLVGKNMSLEDSADAAKEAYELLLNINSIDKDNIELPLRRLADKLGIKVGQLFGIIRVAVTGQKVSPPLFESMEIIGRDKVLTRIQNAIKMLERLVESDPDI
jgi:glutamyl-tRNA synthetase